MVAVVVIALIGLTGCDGGQQDVSNHPLVGTWNWEEDPLWQWQFQTDGTGTRGDADEETRFTWQIENGGHLRLHIQGGGRESWSYTISGYNLTLDNRQLAGEIYTYRRADAPPAVNLDLVDTWHYDGATPWRYNFYADGTGTMGLLGAREVFTWSTPEAGQLHIHTTDARYWWHYTIDGNYLNLTDRQTGEVFRYIREGAVPVQTEEPEEIPEPDAPIEAEGPAELERLGDEAALIGTWACQDDAVPHAWMCLLTFEASGRFTDGDGDGGTFFIDGTYLTLAFDAFQSSKVEFMIVEGYLFLQGDGIDVTLVRQ